MSAGKTFIASGLAITFFLTLSPGCLPRFEADRKINKDEAIKTFSRLTGIQWDDSFSVIGFKDTHGGFLGDGEFAVVVCMSKKKLAAVLESPPPWGDKWLTGPVKGEIGFHCAFIYPHSPGTSTDRETGISEYSGGDPEVRDVLSSKSTKYCAKHRGPDSMPWHNGNIMVVVPDKNEVWLSVWDF